jgi:3-hydroxy-9,10-secoandrosta-1,3,5(10)-triene-9,17-dione monooxygenase reductase component
MAIDVRAFRQTIGHYATGVAVVAFEVDGAVRAMTANSLTSLSLDPPLLLFCVGKHTKTGRTIHQASRFSINILADGQRDISTYFAGAWKTGPAPSFAFLDWDAGPQLEGSAASIGCDVHAIHEGGDHWIVVGRVIALHRPQVAQQPLLFYRGAYAALAQERELAGPAMGFEGIAW